MITFSPSSVTQVVETAPLRASSVRVNSRSLGMHTSPLAKASKMELGDLAVTDVLVTKSRPLDPSSGSMLVGEPKKSSSSSMRLWWVSMSLLIELAGEQGKVVTSCSTGIPHVEMRLDRSAELVVDTSSFTSSTSSSSWKRDMVDSLVRSISTSIQLLSMEVVFSMSKWSARVSRRPPCARNVVSMVGLVVVVVVVVYLLLGQGRE